MYRVLRPPRLRTKVTEAEHHRVTWLELFYDLVFVVAVAELGHRLYGDVSWVGALGFVGLFIPLWWAWAGFTFYADRYDTDDLGQRLLAVGQMVAIAMMAASISGEEADSSRAFAAAYVAARVILIVMYLRARRHVPETKNLVTGYIRGFSAGATLWLISVFVPTPWRFVLWALGLVVSFWTPFAMRRVQAKAPLDVSHLPERFGLFTILVLGESMAAVVKGVSHTHWNLETTATAILAVLTASALWWLYFANVEGSVVRRKPDQRKAWKPTAWIYSHLPLAVSLTATGIGLEFIVTHHAHDAERWLLSVGIAVSLLSLALMHAATESDDHDRKDRLLARVRVACAVIALAVGVFGHPVSALGLGMMFFILCGAQVAIDIYVKRRAQREAAL